MQPVLDQSEVVVAERQIAAIGGQIGCGADQLALESNRSFVRRHRVAKLAVARLCGTEPIAGQSGLMLIFSFRRQRGGHHLLLVQRFAMHGDGLGRPGRDTQGTEVVQGRRQAAQCFRIARFEREELLLNPLRITPKPIASSRPAAADAATSRR